MNYFIINIKILFNFYLHSPSFSLYYSHLIVSFAWGKNHARTRHLENFLHILRTSTPVQTTMKNWLTIEGVSKKFVLDNELDIINLSNFSWTIETPSTLHIEDFPTMPDPSLIKCHLQLKEPHHSHVKSFSSFCFQCAQVPLPGLSEYINMCVGAESKQKLWYWNQTPHFLL